VAVTKFDHKQACAPPPVDRRQSAIEALARDIYLRMVTGPAGQSKTLVALAEMARTQAKAFYDTEPTIEG
jgi:predicted ribonuclease YlaK